MIVVWTNGCFDVLHRGHFELFKFAKSLGSVLYVGVDSDEKVRKDKGPNRPYNTLLDRIFALESIKYIDKVFSFDSSEELESLIWSCGCDILVVGSDWKGKTIIGSKYVKKITYFDRIEKYSTTNILGRRKYDNIRF